MPKHVDDKNKFQVDPHIHKLNAGGVTSASSQEGSHTHSLPGGGQTPSDQTGAGHDHGGGMGGPIFDRAQFAKELFQINGVEIFASGTFNGDTYSDEDLDGMVSAFNENQKTLKPFLKLGHNNGQKLLANDGLPAAGWIGALKRIGNKLVADFIDIPRSIFELLKNKAFRNVSSEIYFDIELNGKKYKHFLSAVALLGSDMPAVESLEDILALYGLGNCAELKNYADKSNKTKIIEYTNLGKKETHMPTEQEIKLQAELDANKKAFAKSESAMEKMRKDNATAKAELDKANEELKKAENSKKAADLKSYVSDLTAKDLVSKGMTGYVEALMGEEKAEYTIGENKLDKQGLITGLLKVAKEYFALNTKTKTESGNQSTTDSEDAQHKAILKYASENKVNYGDAYAALENQKGA